MKLTKKQLMMIIKEEIEKVDEIFGLSKKEKLEKAQKDIAAKKQEDEWKARTRKEKEDDAAWREEYQGRIDSDNYKQELADLRSRKQDEDNLRNDIEYGARSYRNRLERDQKGTREAELKRMGADSDPNPWR